MIAARRALYIAAGLPVVVACNLDPRPEDPGDTPTRGNTSDDNQGSGGSGSPVFGVGGSSGAPPDSTGTGGTTGVHQSPEQIADAGRADAATSAPDAALFDAAVDAADRDAAAVDAADRDVANDDAPDGADR